MKYLPAAIVVVLCTMMLSAPARDTGSTRVAEAIKGKVHQFYHHWNTGDVQSAFDMIAVPSNGFLGNGGFLADVPTREAHRAIVQEYESYYEIGFKSSMQPKHVTVDAHDDWAVASYYIEGSTTEPGEDPEMVMMRAMLVWAVGDDDGEWRIHHWHMSPLKTPDADD